MEKLKCSKCNIEKETGIHFSFRQITKKFPKCKKCLCVNGTEDQQKYISSYKETMKCIGCLCSCKREQFSDNQWKKDYPKCRECALEDHQKAVNEAWKRKKRGEVQYDNYTTAQRFGESDFYPYEQ